MPGRRSYKKTLFDREGPDAGIRLKAYSYAAIAGGASIPMFIGLAGLWQTRPIVTAALVILGPPALTLAVAKMTLRAMDGTEAGMQKVLAGGASTPYTEQYSYQQALVMQGRLDDALASYEAMIAGANSAVDVRIRAAELYTREAKRHDRAAELLQEVLKHPAVTAGEEIYAANRLADLLSTHLGQPGRALVQLRRLADRYPDTVVGERARQAIRTLKALQPPASEG